MAVSVVKLGGPAYSVLLREVAARRASNPDGRRAATLPAEAEPDSVTHMKRLLAADIHDQLTPTLTALLLDMENYKRRQPAGSDVRAQVGDYQDRLRDLLSGVREMLTTLDGEAAKLREGLPGLLGHQLEDYAERTGIGARLTVSPEWPGDLGFATSIQIFRIVEAALRNVELHSGAEHVTLTLRSSGDELSVLLHDDGCGTGQGSLTPGHGILGMKERALVIGGSLDVQRRRAGGTTVKLTVPLRGRRDG